MTGSPFSLSSAAVSFSFRVGDSLIDLASWLRLIRLFLPVQVSQRRRVKSLASTLRLDGSRIALRFERGAWQDAQASSRSIDTIRHGRILDWICTIINEHSRRARGCSKAANPGSFQRREISRKGAKTQRSPWQGGCAPLAQMGSAEEMASFCVGLSGFLWFGLGVEDGFVRRVLDGRRVPGS